MSQIKHVIKCRGCGHVYDMRIDDISNSGSVMNDIIRMVGGWMLSGRRCPSCNTVISLNQNPTVEIDVEELR